MYNKNEASSLVFSASEKNLIIDYDFMIEKFDRTMLQNHPLIANNLDSVGKMIDNIENIILKNVRVIQKDNKYRKISLYITLALLLLIFIFAIVGGATELYYFFYLAIGFFFIKTTAFTIINYFIMNPKFNDALTSIKNDCKTRIEEANTEFKVKGFLCGLNYARVVNQKVKITFYKKIKLYILFFQVRPEIEEDIEDFELNYFQMLG